MKLSHFCMEEQFNGSFFIGPRSPRGEEGGGDLYEVSI